VSFDASVHIPAGAKVRCLGCQRHGRAGTIHLTVPARTVAHARIVRDEAAARPGTGAHFCPKCETWMEVDTEEVRAVVAA